MPLQTSSDGDSDCRPRRKQRSACCMPMCDQLSPAVIRLVCTHSYRDESAITFHGLTSNQHYIVALFGRCRWNAALKPESLCNAGWQIQTSQVVPCLVSIYTRHQIDTLAKHLLLLAYYCGRFRSKFLGTFTYESFA